eukprot:1160203-Pelagomonas_calceolata.AAC.3
MQANKSSTHGSGLLQQASACRRAWAPGWEGPSLGFRASLSGQVQSSWHIGVTRGYKGLSQDV